MGIYRCSLVGQFNKDAGYDGACWAVVTARLGSLCTAFTRKPSVGGPILSSSCLPSICCPSWTAQAGPWPPISDHRFPADRAFFHPGGLGLEVVPTEMGRLHAEPDHGGGCNYLFRRLEYVRSAGDQVGYQPFCVLFMSFGAACRSLPSW